MKKRSESNLITSLCLYLQVLENSGKILFWSRQQAGNVCIPGRDKFYKMRLGREGISDLWVIPSKGEAPAMIWIEAKLEGEKQSAEQIKFQSIIENLCCPTEHFYLLVHSCQELESYFKKLKVI